MKFLKILTFLLITTKTLSKECKRDIMTSYGLQGKKEFTEKTNPLCHTITKNCCSSHDVLKIFDLVTTSLQPTLVSFYEKMTISLQKLKTLNESIQKVSHGEFSDEKQKKFCKKSKKAFKEFDFEEMINKLTIGYEKSISSYRDAHYAFYCTLCDFEAHVDIDVKSKKIGLDSTSCMALIRNNKEYIAALNVDLVNYFENLQNLLDCSFYEKSFEFPFLFEYQDGFKVSTKNCLEKFDEDSNEMIEQCVDFCAQMNIAGVSRHFEGDPGFVLKAVDYYENLVEQIVEKVKDRKDNGKEFNPMDHLAVMNHDNPSRELHGLRLVKKKGSVTRVLHHVDELKIKNNTRKLNDKKENRILHGIRKTIKTKKQRKRQKIKYKQYLHALKKKDKRLRRILETKKPTSGLSPEKLAEYKTLYEEISCLFHPKSDEIFKRTTDPIDISKFQKNYLYEQGLNPLKYLQGLNFDLNREEILKTIHGPQNSEKMEYILIVLLDSVSKNNIEIINEELTKSYNFEIPEDLIDLREEKDEAFDKAQNEVLEIVGMEDLEGVGSELEVVEEEVEGKKGEEESRILEDLEGKEESRILEDLKGEELTVRENDVEKFFEGGKFGKDFHV